MKGGNQSGVSTISLVGCSTLGGVPPAPQKEEEEEEHILHKLHVFALGDVSNTSEQSSLGLTL
jgi:hypothetical protein